MGGENYGTLNPADSARLQDLADRFEQAWKTGRPADPAGFLPPPGDPLRGPCLLELVKLDLEIRWLRGQPPGTDRRADIGLRRMLRLGVRHRPSCLLADKQDSPGTCLARSGAARPEHFRV